MARHQQRTVEQSPHHNNRDHHNNNSNRRHHYHHKQRARSLSPRHYRQQQHQQQHHRHHHHRSQSPRLRSSPPSPHQENRRVHRCVRSPALHHSHRRSRFRNEGRRRRSCSSVIYSELRSGSVSPASHRRRPPSSVSPHRGGGGGHRRRGVPHKETLAHQLLKLLSSSAGPYARPRRHRSNLQRNESLYNSWSYGFPKSFRRAADFAPLLATDDESLIMPRRSPHHGGNRLQRARDEPTETERLRKIREDATEAERLRIAAEEAARSSRRARLQNELDEAELRRVRALEHFNEAERQRRELQIEDRLRQLEDQDLPMEQEKKASVGKRCCKSCKIVFGIFLSLGLVFVFYLIVSSIMGTSSPLDIFNFNLSQDPLLVDIGIHDNLPPNITDLLENESFPEIILKKMEDNSTTTILSLETTTENASNTTEEFIFESVVINPYDTEHDGSDDVLTYLEHDIPLYPEEDQIFYDTYGEPFARDTNDKNNVNRNLNSEFSIIYTSDADQNNEHLINFGEMDPNDEFIIFEGEDDQELSPSNQMNPEYTKPFEPSYEDYYANKNFPQINRTPNKFIHRNIAKSAVPEFFRTPRPVLENEYVDEERIDRSDDNFRQMSSNPFENNAFYGDMNIPTQRTGLSFGSSFDQTPMESRKRESLEQLEMEIIDTILDIADKEESKTRRTFSARPGIINPAINRQRTKINKPFPKHTRNQNFRNKPIDRSSARSKGPRARAPPLLRNGPKSGTRLRNPMRSRGVPLRPRQFPSRSRLPGNDPHIGMPNSRRYRFDSRRGPRNSEFHVPPPEFRYPKSAGSIQDIINHMNKDEDKNKSPRSRNDEETKLNKGFKIGDQDHVLEPHFINIDSPVSYDRPGPGPGLRPHKQRRTVGPRRRGNKNKKQKRKYPNPKIKQRSPGRPIKTRGGPYRNRFPVIEEADDVIFHSDGSISHISDEKSPLVHSSPHKNKPTRRDESRPLYSHQPSNEKYPSIKKKEYRPSPEKETIRKSYKTKPIKVLLDVYPVTSHVGNGKYVPKYESKISILDEDGHKKRELSSRSRDRYYTSGEEDHKRPKSRYNSRERYEDSHRTRYSSHEISSSSRPRYNTDDRYTTHPGVSYSSRERYSDREPSYRDRDREINTKEYNYRPRDRYETTPKPRYNSRDQDLDVDIVLPYSEEDRLYSPDPRYRTDRPTRTSSSEILTSSSGDGQHTITLNINLFSRKPEDRRGNRRMDDLLDDPREVSLSIPLSQSFTPMDVYKALMKHVKRNSPYAQFLVSNRKGLTDDAPNASNVKPFDLKEGVALLGTLEHAFMNLNPSLPQDVQFALLSAPNNQSAPDPLSFNKLSNPDASDFDYTEGFVASIVEDIDDVRLEESQTDMEEDNINGEHEKQVGTKIITLRNKSDSVDNSDKQ